MLKNALIHVCILLFTMPAYAQTYEITIDPLNPAGEIKSTICQKQQNLCFLSIPYVTESNQQEDYMNIATRFVNGYFEADFMLKGNQLSLSQKGITHFKTKFLNAQKLTLFFVHPNFKNLDEMTGQAIPDNRKIAEIELSVVQVSN